MPLSNAGNPNRLLKLLQIELRNTVASESLREWGWYDFRSFDRPQTDDVIAFASAAFNHLSIDSNSYWRQNRGVMEAVFSFMHKTCGLYPTIEQIQALIAILDDFPVSGDDVASWFDQTFCETPF